MLGRHHRRVVLQTEMSKEKQHTGNNCSILLSEQLKCKSKFMFTLYTDAMRWFRQYFH